MQPGNIFGASADEVRMLFDDYLDGAESCIALALSEKPLDAPARNAIEKSLESFGYGSNSCLFATLHPRNEQAQEGVPLDPQALFLLVEGLDPLCVIAADDKATQALSRAFRCDYEPDSALRVFGRPAVAFGDLSALMNSERGKQQAWHLLKSLPKR